MVRGPTSHSLQVFVQTNEISSFRRMHRLREALLLVTSCCCCLTAVSRLDSPAGRTVEKWEFSREEETRNGNSKEFNGSGSSSDSMTVL